MGAMVALLSLIADWLPVGAIPVVPIAALTSSGVSNRLASSRSTRGRGTRLGVGVTTSA